MGEARETEPKYLTGQTHISWFIGVGCLGLVGGVALALVYNISDQMANWFIGLAIILLILAFISRMRILLLAALLAAMMLGLVRGSVAQTDVLQYQNYIGKEVTLVATVSDDPSSSKGKMTLQLEDISLSSIDKPEPVKLTGKVWVSTSSANKLGVERSDRVKLTGELSEGFGAFGASMRSAKLVEVTHLTGVDPMRDARNDFGAKLANVIPSPGQELGMGILMGQKTALSDDIKTAFIAASLTHILVASGYNLTVLTRFARRLLAKHSRLLAVIAGMALVICFSGITGMSASMLRAGLVTLLSLVTWYYGRSVHPGILLAFAAAVTAMIDPTMVWGDAGWYLSFGSFAGVIILAPLLDDLFRKRADEPDETAASDRLLDLSYPLVARLRLKFVNFLRSFKQVFIETFSAQLATLPIIAIFMGNVSLVGLLTNLIVLPLLPLTMLLTFIAGLAVYMLPAVAASIVAWPANQLLGFIVWVARWGADLPGARVEIKLSLGQIAIFYSVLLLVILVLKRVTKHNFYRDNVVK